MGKGKERDKGNEGERGWGQFHREKEVLVSWGRGKKRKRKNIYISIYKKEGNGATKSINKSTNDNKL